LIFQFGESILTEISPTCRDQIQLLELLQSVSCEQYFPLFEKMDINADLLSIMDKPALKEMGITKVGDRLRIQIVISLLNIEKIRSRIPIRKLVESIKSAYVGLTDIEKYTLNQVNQNRESNGQKLSSSETGEKNNVIRVITQDGHTYEVDISKCFNSTIIKTRILQETGISSPLIPDEWSTYYIDKKKSVHLMFNIELATICNSPNRKEKGRIIFCRTGEAPSTAAIEKSNKILAMYGENEKTEQKRGSMLFRNIMGQRPPSQLISTNLSEYFPDLGPTELKKVMRNSYRMSVYGNKMMRRQSVQSLGNRLSSGSINSGAASSRNSIYSNFSMMSRPDSMMSGISQAHISTGFAMKINQTVGDVLLSSNRALKDVGNDEEKDRNEEEEEEEEDMLGGDYDVDDDDDDWMLSEDFDDAFDDEDLSGSGTETETEEDEIGTEVKTAVRVVSSSHSVEKIDTGGEKTVKLVTDGKTAGQESSARDSSISILEEEDDGVNSLARAYSKMLKPKMDGSIENIWANEISKGPSVWHKGAKIGQGSYGSVFLGLDGLTGELMAVKEVDLPTSSEDSRNKMVVALKREMDLLRELHHENIVRYLGTASDSKKMYIFLEYIPGGSVSSMLHTYGPFEEPLVRNFLTQVLIGVRFLHNNGIIHRDIKGANILIDINGTVKIGDFGISKKITPHEVLETNIQDDNDKKNRRVSFQGSVYWMAPEVVKQTASTEKSDIWSVGCLAVEMLTAEHPYPGFSQMQAIFRIGNLDLPEYPADCTPEAKDFLDLAFETDYRKRSSASKLLKHSFLKPVLMFRKKARLQKMATAEAT